MATHPWEQIDYLLECCRSIGIEMNLIEAGSRVYPWHIMPRKQRIIEYQMENKYTFKEDIGEMPRLFS
jgi:hypothetical protein